MSLLLSGAVEVARFGRRKRPGRVGGRGAGCLDGSLAGPAHEIRRTFDGVGDSGDGIESEGERVSTGHGHAEHFEVRATKLEAIDVGDVAETLTVLEQRYHSSISTGRTGEYFPVGTAIALEVQALDRISR